MHLPLSFNYCVSICFSIRAPLAKSRKWLQLHEPEANVFLFYLLLLLLFLPLLQLLEQMLLQLLLSLKMDVLCTKSSSTDTNATSQHCVQWLIFLYSYKLYIFPVKAGYSEKTRGGLLKCGQVGTNWKNERWWCLQRIAVGKTLNCEVLGVPM